MLSLCLSRACLGQKIGFTYKRLKRPFSLAPVVTSLQGQPWHTHDVIKAPFFGADSMTGFNASRKSEPYCTTAACSASLHRGCLGSPSLHRVRKRLLFEFFLCLSRACLGKLIVFIQKVGTKFRFLTLQGIWRSLSTAPQSTGQSTAQSTGQHSTAQHSTEYRSGRSGQSTGPIQVSRSLVRPRC